MDPRGDLNQQSVPTQPSVDVGATVVGGSGADNSGMSTVPAANGMVQQPQPGFNTDGAVPQFEENNIQPQAMSYRAHPESQPVQPQPEVVPMVEFKEHEVSPEVAEYVQKVDKENLELEKQVVHQGVPIVQPPMTVEEPEIVLPMSQTSYQHGLKSKVSLSARWLAEWCLRLIKKFGGKVGFSPEQG